MRLLAKLGLGGCDNPPDVEPKAYQAFDAWRREPPQACARLVDALAYEPGVPKDRVLSQTTPLERRQLCAWYLRARGWIALYRGGRYPPTDNVGYRCDDGRTFTLQDADTCLARFPSCSTTVAEAMRCKREAATDLCGAASPECTRSRACWFGLGELPP